MTSQMHGKRFEDFIKSSFYGSSDYNRTPHELFDIEKHFDKKLTLPTSIKTTSDSSNLICLADARKLWNINEPFRMLIGIYKQTKDFKSFNMMYEFLISKEEFLRLKGNITFEDVNKLHEKIKSFEPGIEGQNLYKEFYKNNKHLYHNKSLIKLNPKVDSKKQRRLQCSIKLTTLKDNISKINTYTKDVLFRDMEINFKIKSSKRY